MSIKSEGYFDCLASYMNHSFYGIPSGADKITLVEKIYTDTGETTHTVNLKYKGKLFAIKLDKEKNKGKHEPLFHFLDDTAKPWSKRCDFVLFNYHNRQIKVYLFEFKHTTIAGDSIAIQLNASQKWCQALVQIVKIYTGYKGSLNLTKYVLTERPDPSPYLDITKKFFNVDHSIRHYSYSEIEGMHLGALDNNKIEILR